MPDVQTVAALPLHLDVRTTADSHRRRTVVGIRDEDVSSLPSGKLAPAARTDT
jgi:hypothetical protein